MHADNQVSNLNSQPIRAAVYMRMSTEHQQYSTENQMDVILEYTKKHNMIIVREYSDEGKSGLGIQWRGGLQSLINDVQTSDCDFGVILAYDVSRWGRFQDADESGYYEFICRKAGVHVHYCAEQFVNDGSPTANIIKSVKRSMAGEYSRELSVKVFKGQCTLIEKGFRQGGHAGYGLRRALIDEHRQMKGLLEYGERKSIQTDRVILIPGPSEEVAIVQQMYKWFVEDRMREVEIANKLNGIGIFTDFNRPWTQGTVHQVLTNEKYIGNNIYNRHSYKLKQRRVVNPPEMYIRADGVFEGIVDSNMYARVQEIIAARSRRYSDDELLSFLSTVLKSTGRLSSIIIDEHDGPSSTAYRSRFGSLIRAYTLIGYIPGFDTAFIEINKRLRAMHPNIIKQITDDIIDLGGDIMQDDSTGLIEINREFTASLVIARCKQTDAGSNRWNIQFDNSLRPDMTIAARMDSDNNSLLDYYLLPATELAGEKLRLAETNGLYYDAFRFDSLDYLYYLARRASILEVAHYGIRS